MADVHREIGVLAALDAFQEVVVLARGVRVEVDFLGADDRLQDVR